MVDLTIVQKRKLFKSSTSVSTESYLLEFFCFFCSYEHSSVKTKEAVGQLLRSEKSNYNCFYKQYFRYEFVIIASSGKSGQVL